MLVPVLATVNESSNTSSRYSRTFPVAEVVMLPVTLVFASVYVPVIVGQTVVGLTTLAEAEGWLADAHAADEVTVAAYTSPEASVNPETVQLPVLFAVVVQLEVVGLVLFRVILAFAIELPEIEVAVESNRPLISVLITGGTL